MATVKFVVYNEGSEDTAHVNDYISDGHGDEVLVRTNRYVTGDHACGNRCIGVNCPSDSVLATEYMQQLRALYEHNRAGRGLKGATESGQGASHYQLIISWEPGEHVPVEERYEMAQELIQRTKLKNYANLLAAHENKEHDHIHLSTSAHSITGDAKLSMNNALLYDLRREMDRICVAHGYSIVEAPELWGDPEYKKWFECVRDLDVVPIHPPRPKSVKDKSEEEKYAAAKAEEHLAKKALLKELAAPHKITSENRGTDFFALPHICHPSHPDDPLYIYALDKEGNRRAPLHLECLLQSVWAKRCSERLETMDDFEGKNLIATRLQWAQDNAWNAYALMDRLDIGTRAELKSHTEAVGSDIAKYRQEVARQEKVIATATETGDTVKLERATARHKKAQEKLDTLNAEYHAIKSTQALLDHMDSKQWEEFRQSMMDGALRKLNHRARFNRLICNNLVDIGILLGMTEEEASNCIEAARKASMDEISGQWVTVIGSYRVTVIARRGGISTVYSYIGQQHHELEHLRDEIAVREMYGRTYGEQCVATLTRILLHLSEEEYDERERRIARSREYEIENRINEARIAAEKIRYHNQNCRKQLQRAKTELSAKLAAGEADAAQEAWDSFFETCDAVMRSYESTKTYVRMSVPDRKAVEGIQDPAKEIKEMQRLSKKSLSKQISYAQAVFDEHDQKNHQKSKEKEGPSR